MAFAAWNVPPFPYMSITMMVSILLPTIDVYESPDGSKTHFQQLNIATDGIYSDLNEASVDFPYQPWEDWGITFDVVEAAPDHLSLLITQSSGQQFGTLRMESGFDLSKQNDQGSWENFYSSSALFLKANPFYITSNGTTELTIDWPATCEELPAGSYSLHLRIVDTFGAGKLHPFTRDYTDQQFYDIEFTVF